MRMTSPSRIGRYEIVRRLGKGMTDVYLATDTTDNRKVALKLIEAGADMMTQLIVEAERRGAALQKDLHSLDPRVIEIYDFGELDGYFFVAMEYVAGRNLAEVLRSDRAVDAIRAAAIALEICEQLSKFHACQLAVVHGDIKPSNIHLGPSDTVRLLDFGIAKALRADGHATSHHFGSPGYCSPERLNRSEVDQQSDLWAVGATLYEMLAGVPPFQAESTRKLESLIRSKRAPRSLGPNCPRALRLVVAKALAPNPEQRYGSASALQKDLQAFLEHEPTVAEMERPAGWNANSTIEAARACLRFATRTVRKASRWLRVAGAVGWYAAGMTIWIGGTVGWQFWQARRVAAASTMAVVKAPSVTSVPASLTDDLPQLYAGAAERVLDSYRKSTDGSLHDFDWHKAEVYLERAVELGRTDDRTIGELALSRGYATLERLNGGEYSGRAAANLRTYAVEQLRMAAEKMPRSPDPHLALARVYVYSLPNFDRAMVEFGAADRLGAVLGAREMAQKADAHRTIKPRPIRTTRVARRRPWR